MKDQNLEMMSADHLRTLKEELLPILIAKLDAEKIERRLSQLRGKGPTS